MNDLLSILIGLGVTFGFIGIGIIGKRAVRELRREDKCLGMEMSLAAMASTAVYFLDLIRESAPEGKINNDLGYFGFAIICYIFVVGLHDCWENEQDGPDKTIALVWLANLIGAIALGVFVAYIKKGA